MLVDTVIPDVNEWRLDPQLCERGADLAPMVGPMVEHLRQPDPLGCQQRRPVVPDPEQHLLRIDLLVQHLHPGRAVGLHLGPQLSQIDRLLVDPRARAAADHEEVAAIGSDQVLHGLEDGTVGARDGSLHLLGRQIGQVVEQRQGGPDVMAERIGQEEVVMPAP